MDEEKRLLDLYYDWEDKQRPPQKEEQCCARKEIIIDDEQSMRVCVFCGQVEDWIHGSKSEYISTGHHTRKRWRAYIRRGYFTDKLKAMASLIQPTTVEFKNVIKRMEKKKDQIDGVADIRSFLKKWKKVHFYKNAYTIYLSIFKVNLIPLTELDVKRLVRRFFTLEDAFKQCNVRRKNMYSYTCCIYLLLKQEGYQCYRNVFTPLNSEFILQKLN
jgi:hypothetical protein